MDGTDGSQNFVDSSLQAHSVTAKGSARISTAQSEFGGASGLFGGAGDYLSVADSSDWAFGSGDFTIDFWVRWNALPVSGQFQAFVGQSDANSNVVWMFTLYNNAGTYTFRFLQIPVSGGAMTIDITNTTTLSANTWYHIALVRSGNSWYMFKNGTQFGSTATEADPVTDHATSLTIGRWCTNYPRELNGWLDEFRISKGVARWTSNFTPPTAPY